MTNHSPTSRGILNPRAGAQNFHLSRQFPTSQLSFFVQHYWIVNWDLRGRDPYRSETLPYPSIHLVFERDNSRIVGVMRGKFSTLLCDKGRVFGIKFRPGAFYPFVHTPISQFTDKTLRLCDVFGDNYAALENTLMTLDDEAKMVELVEDFLRGKLPERDENITLINQIVDCIIEDRTIIKVDDIVTRLGINKRTLQRLFSQYVGVTPKWVIKRYRLHEAAELLATGDTIDWPQLAVELGYFDQAHFIKDFKSIVGTTPAEYAKLANLSS